MTTSNGNGRHLSALESIVGDSEPIRALREWIDAVARTTLSVLIEGPTGAGKELVAAALHAASGRRGAFVPCNVCAISDTMFEDAMFGHVRGAFTGAFSDVPGFLAEANGGTVFLDEVSGLPQTMQAKLLRAIETGVFRPVGAKRDTHSEFRLVAATNEPLQVLVDNGLFRPDFAHRVSAVRVTVPPLADRLDDLPLLVRHFLQHSGHGHVRVADDAIEVLRGHAWPGNVRELRHVIESSAIFSNGKLVGETVRMILSRRLQAAGSRIEMEALERRTIIEALERSDWNTETVSRELGMHRATLYRRMRKFGIARVTSPIRTDSQAFARIAANVSESS